MLTCPAGSHNSPLPQQRAQPAAGECAEAQLFAQVAELIGFAVLAQQGLDRDGARCVQRDAGESAIKPRLFGVFAQFSGAAGGTT